MLLTSSVSHCMKTVLFMKILDGVGIFQNSCPKLIQKNMMRLKTIEMARYRSLSQTPLTVVCGRQIKVEIA